MKPFALSSFAVASLLAGAAIAIACSSSSSSEFPGEPPKPDAEADGGGGFGKIPDPVDGSLESGLGACAPKLPGALSTVWKAPVKRAVCTPALVKSYVAACLAKPSQTESDGTCAKFKTDNPECGACAEPTDKSGPIQWDRGDVSFYTTNIGGCIALAQASLPQPQRCGQAFSEAVQCGRASCSYCFGAGGSYDQFTECQKAASKVGLCLDYERASLNECEGYKNADAGTLSCFHDGTAIGPYYERIVSLFCGSD